MLRPDVGAADDRTYEDLRREARRLEGELEVQLQSLAKLAYRSDGGFGARVGAAVGHDQLAQARASEVEALLRRLSEVNDEMSAAARAHRGAGPDARAHTLERHRDVLAEYAQEYRRLDVGLRAARDRAALLGGTGVPGEGAPLLGVQVHPASGALLRERTQLTASAGYVDDMLSQAQSVTRSLLEQRRVFDGVQDKLLTVAERFPAMNGLLNAIRRKKSKDTLVLSAVIAGCTVFMLVYIFSK